MDYLLCYQALRISSPIVLKEWLCQHHEAASGWVLNGVNETKYCWSVYRARNIPSNANQLEKPKLRSNVSSSCSSTSKSNLVTSSAKGQRYWLVTLQTSAPVLHLLGDIHLWCSLLAWYSASAAGLSWKLNRQIWKPLLRAMGSVIDGPPTTRRWFFTHGNSLRVLSSRTKVSRWDVSTSERNLKRTRLVSGIKCEVGGWWVVYRCERQSWLLCLRIVCLGICRIYRVKY